MPVRAGVLVDRTDNNLMSAFRVMLQLHNSKHSRLKVTDETRMLPMDNSFSVGTASTSRFMTILRDVYYAPATRLEGIQR